MPEMFGVFLLGWMTHLLQVRPGRELVISPRRVRLA